MVGIKDIARVSNTSIASVSRVLNNSGYVAERTRLRIETAIADLRYHPNTGARALRSGRSSMIGILMPSLDVEFFARLADRIEKRLFDCGYQAVLCSTGEEPRREEASVAALLAKQVDGIVVASVNGESDHLEDALARGVRVVALDRQMGIAGTKVVQSDHAQGGRLAAGHLLNLGHQRIAICGAPAYSSPVKERVAGACAQLAHEGLEPFAIALGTEHTVETCESLAASLLDRDKSPTAIIATSDIAAIGVMRCARNMKIAVPSDLSVTGFDDIPAARFVHPELTTIRQHHDRLAEAVVGYLIERSGGAPAPAVLAVDLVVRGSTSPPR